jgi:ATP-dependent DNA helicase PIF1
MAATSSTECIAALETAATSAAASAAAVADDKLMMAGFIYNRQSSFKSHYKLIPIVGEGSKKARNSKKRKSTDYALGTMTSSAGMSRTGEYKSKLPLTDDEIKLVACDYPIEHGECISIVLKKKNLFITGGPGSGKTKKLLIIRKVCESLDIKHVLLAPTSDTAIALGCQTVNSWMNFPSIHQSADQLLKKAKKEKDKWLLPEVIMIDNIALLECEYLTVLHKILCNIHENSMPFGGVCMLFAGDLAQIPNYRNSDSFKLLFFEREEWLLAKFETIYLGNNFKHKSDPLFAAILDRMRLGMCTEEDRKFFSSLVKRRVSRKIYPELFKLPCAWEDVSFNSAAAVHPPRLNYINVKSDNDNEDMLKKIQPNVDLRIVFKARETVQSMVRDVKEKSDSFLTVIRSGAAKESITLCTGAQVMLLVDLPGNELLTRNAGTVPAGTAGTAGTGTLLRGAVGIIVSWSSEIVLDTDSPAQRFPYVKFHGLPEFPEAVMIQSYTWYEPESKTSYQQLPLMHAWSITPHNMPELFVDSMYIRTKLIFDARQFYACISKVKTSKGLNLEAFRVSWLQLPAKIVSYYRLLEANSKV